MIQGGRSMAKKIRRTSVVSQGGAQGEGGGRRPVSAGWLICVGIVVLTVLAYLPVFDGAKEFTNWDDGVYVTEQPLVKKLDAGTIATFFNPSTEVSANYHPLTMISLAVDYALFGENASAFARTSLLFHVLNTLLVFWFVMRLLNGNVIVAGLTACLWGVHPMHVESVAWISERKDVLYTFFLLLSLIAYQQYLRQYNLVYFLACCLAFIASCLSKAMAVPLPIALVLLDYVHQRRLTIRSVAEKLPLLAASVWFGITALTIQSKVAIAAFDVITPFQRVAFAGYSFVMYWVKMVFPFGLATFHPYPTLEAGGEINPLYFLMPIIALFMIALPVYLTRRHVDTQRLVVLGIGLFTLFVALVLQLISVGQVIMAERYTYVPYVGSLLLLSYVFWRLIARRPLIGWGVSIVFIIACVVLTYAQAGVWKNSKTLWTQVIERYPYEWTESAGRITVTRVGAASAYGSRASYLMNKGADEEAFSDLRVLEIVGSTDWKGQQMLGVMYGRRQDYQRSIEVLTKVIAMVPQSPEPYYNRGVSYAMSGSHAEAASDFESAISRGIIEPDLRTCVFGAARENLDAVRYDLCLAAAERATAMYPNDAEGPFLAGTALVNLKRYDDAISMLRRTVTLKPDYAVAWFNLAVAYKQRGTSDQARTAAKRAADLGY
ncbi:MAG: tetratricopeptide repeat protein, partial [Candidatus Kapabacteria bacterium]|nr:tetratricopeptide repeat protein [Candidatus Kapabacteria bacterium]